jgi:predicted DNA-binding transcriptional regulator AlpA
MNAMKAKPSVSALDPKPHYARAKAACAHFQIARSTLWQWTKTRHGFPQPLKAGEKVTLFDINAIDAFLKAQAAKQG